MSVDLRESLYKISLNYVKKEPYTGSFGDQRFKLEKFVPGEDAETVLRLWLWPGPLCFEKTEEEKRSFIDYSMDQAGLDAAVDRLMEMQEEIK